MKKLVRILAAEVAVIAVLAAALLLLILNPAKKEAESWIFADHAITDVASVHVENSFGSLDVSAQSGGYVIEGVPSELVDLEAFIDFLGRCSAVSALKRVDSDQRELAEYGLAEPSAQVSVTFRDGDKLELSLGDREPLSGSYYCAVDGEKGVYLLDEAWASRYLTAREQLISFYITPKLEVSSALSAIRDVTFSGGPLAEPVTIESVSAGDEQVKELARSFGAATHIVRGAGVYELDQTYGLTVLEPLCGMMAQSIAYYGLTGEQVDAMGFAQPDMKVEFDYKNGTQETEHYVLRFLKATEDGSYFYANAEGSGVIYIVERYAFFDLSYDKLLLRWFLSPLLMDVEGITVENGSEVYDFAIDQTDPKNPTVAMNGQEVDITLFRSLFRLLGSAAADGNYLGVQSAPEGEPSMRITYRYTGGKDDDVLELYPGGTRRVNVYVNGVCEFAMRDAFVQRVNDALTAIGAGESFDINW